MYIFSKKNQESNTYVLIETNVLPPTISIDEQNKLILPDGWWEFSKELYEEYCRNTHKYTIFENTLVERFSVAFNPTLSDYTATKRYTVETGGCMYGNNIVQTDRDSQTKMIAEMVALGAGLRPDPSPWKFGNGFANLTNAQMMEVIMTARLHIATAFAVEASVLEQITLGNITTKEQIDAAPWPPNR